MIIEATIVATAIIVATWIVCSRLYQIEVHLYNIAMFINLDLRSAARRYMHITNHEAEIHEHIASIGRRKENARKSKENHNPLSH